MDHYAVLVPLVKTEEGDALLLEVRSQHVRQPGEVCFPGGRAEPGESVTEAAVRETCEELGLSSEDIEVISALEPLVMGDGRKVFPVTARLHIDGLDSLKLSEDEVAEVFLLPEAWFAENTPVHFDLAETPDEDLPEKLRDYLENYGDYHHRGETDYLEYDGHGIWGLTARIIKCWEQKMYQKTAVVTGGANGIGKCIAEEFRKEGVKVYVIDKAAGDHYVGDISDKAVLESFAKMVIGESGGIDYLVNNALPLSKGIDDCSYEEFQYALAVGVTAPFYLAKLFAPHFREGAAIVNISSSRDRMSQPQTESYTAAKGGIAALTHALAVSFAGKVRVNSISPGWIETGDEVYEGADALQQPAGRVGNPLDIANMVLYLCSDKAGFITGENICIDGGMTKLMIYHDDHGWKYEP